VNPGKDKEPHRYLKAFGDKRFFFQLINSI